MTWLYISRFETAWCTASPVTMTFSSNSTSSEWLKDGCSPTAAPGYTMAPGHFCRKYEKSSITIDG